MNDKNDNNGKRQPLLIMIFSALGIWCGFLSILQIEDQADAKALDVRVGMLEGEETPPEWLREDIREMKGDIRAINQSLIELHTQLHGPSR